MTNDAAIVKETPLHRNPLLDGCSKCGLPHHSAPITQWEGLGFTDDQILRYINAHPFHSATSDRSTLAEADHLPFPLGAPLYTKRITASEALAMYRHGLTYLAEHGGAMTHAEKDKMLDWFRREVDCRIVPQ